MFAETVMGCAAMSSMCAVACWRRSEIGNSHWLQHLNEKINLSKLLMMYAGENLDFMKVLARGMAAAIIKRDLTSERIKAKFYDRNQCANYVSGMKKVFKRVQNINVMTARHEITLPWQSCQWASLPTTSKQLTAGLRASLNAGGDIKITTSRGAEQVYIKRNRAPDARQSASKPGASIINQYPKRRPFSDIENNTRQNAYIKLVRSAFWPLLWHLDLRC